MAQTGFTRTAAYLSADFFKKTSSVLVPILLFVHFPLNILNLIYVFCGSKKLLLHQRGAMESWLFQLTAAAEVLSLAACLFLYYYILINELLGSYDPIVWRYGTAAFFYLVLIFAGNDGPSLLMIVYLNRLRQAMEDSPF